MERLIKGTSFAKPEADGNFKSSFCDLSLAVRKGHEECGDSAFVFCDGKKLIAGVFDGVSGEPGAANASSAAAEACLSYLKKQKKCDEKVMKEAMITAHAAIKHGYTTATLLFMESTGSFVAANVGDSPLYGLDAAGEASSELPLGRPVGDKDAIFKYLYFRNLVTSVLGPTGTDMNMHVQQGKLKKGELLILATDGITDNLYFQVKEGYVADTAGTADLASLIGKKRGPQAIVKTLLAAVLKRMAGGKSELSGRMLVPKQDDLAIIAVRRI